MPYKNFKYFSLLLLLLSFGCAKRGSITGGDKDTLAPVLMSSLPKNFSTNFIGKEIKLVFDEYVKLKNANKQLIILVNSFIPKIHNSGHFGVNATSLFWHFVDVIWIVLFVLIYIWQ
jgi:hypothetical protein